MVMRAVSSISVTAFDPAAPGAIGATTPAQGNFTNIGATGNITVLGISSANSIAGNMVASQAQQETATSVGVSVTPGRQQFHPSAVKASVNWDMTNNVIRANYNVSAIAHPGTGSTLITFATPFSSGNYSVMALGSSTANILGYSGKNTGNITINNAVALTGGAADSTDLSAQFVGDQ